MSRLVLLPGRVRIRHIKRGTAAEEGAVQVLNSWFVPQDEKGVNGQQGFVRGSYERRRDEEGKLESLVFPNAIGADGVEHRTRFGVTKGDPSYRPGDEWVEVYWEGDPNPMFVGTPTRGRVTDSTVELSGWDGLWMQKRTRETAAGFNVMGPRDLFDTYTRAWNTELLDDFGVDGPLFAWHDTNLQTTADGRFEYLRAFSDVAAHPGEVLLQAINLNETSSVRAVIPAFVWGQGKLQANRYDDWRFEAQLRVLGGNEKPIAGIQITDLATGTLMADLKIVGNTIVVGLPAPQHTAQLEASDAALPAIVNFAIEARGRHLFFYVNGRLITTRPAWTSNRTIAPSVVLARSPGSLFTAKAYLRELSFERQRAFLLRPNHPATFDFERLGDLRVPGSPAPGGFQAEYYDRTAELTKPGYTTEALRADAAFSPLLGTTGFEPVEKRLDVSLSSSTVKPVATTGQYLAARWTGAVHLDLANYDYRFRMTRNAAGDRYRVWVGHTRFPDSLMDVWSPVAAGNVTADSDWLKADRQFPARSGWYPIVIEYYSDVGGQSLPTFSYQRTGDAGWTVVGADSRVQVSPYGVVKEQIRFDSHYERLKAVMEAWGIQSTCVPKQLESGEFPGRLSPQVRVGRDTDYVLDRVEAREQQVEINAEDVTDSLFVDAAGIADPQGGAQLTVERANYDEAANHLFTMSEYESLSDITFGPLLHQRANSLLALRSAPWEEVQARPDGNPEFVDSFPLTGALAEFKWEPGDGLRLDLPRLGVQDPTPRPILGAQRGFVPAGLGQITAAFRQRPRNPAETFRRLHRQALLQIRNYQGQLVMTSGSLGAAVAGGGAADTYSRLSLPPNLADVVSLTLVIQNKTDASPWDIEVNGTVVSAFTKTGHHDITYALQRAGGFPRVYARAASQGAGSTGNAFYQLQALIRT